MALKTYLWMERKDMYNTFAEIFLVELYNANAIT
jgi:hypothetical protein